MLTWLRPRSGAVALGMRRLEVVADEVIYFLLAGIGCTQSDDVLPKCLVVRRVFAAIGAALPPVVVLLADSRVLLARS